MEKEHPHSLGRGWERNWGGLQPLETFGSWQVIPPRGAGTFSFPKEKMD